MYIMHMGEIIKKRIEESGMRLGDVAKRVGKVRNTFYNWYNRDELPLEDVIKIGRAIKHDFSEDFPALFNQVSDPAQTYGGKVATEVSKCREELSMWKEKYFDLLEKHNHVLTNQLQKLFVPGQ